MLTYCIRKGQVGCKQSDFPCQCSKDANTEALKHLNGKTWDLSVVMRRKLFVFWFFWVNAASECFAYGGCGWFCAVTSYPPGMYDSILRTSTNPPTFVILKCVSFCVYKFPVSLGKKLRSAQCEKRNRSGLDTVKMTESRRGRTVNSHRSAIGQEETNWYQTRNILAPLSL